MKHFAATCYLHMQHLATCHMYIYQLPHEHSKVDIMNILIEGDSEQDFSEILPARSDPLAPPRALYPS